MVPPTPTPTARLVRAATAERAELRRHRDRLLTTREALRAELDRVEAALEDLDVRDALLDRLAASDAAAPRVRPAALAPSPSTPAVSVAADADASSGQGGTVLRGPAIRHAAIRVLLGLPDRPQALHYRAWFGAVCAAGFTVAGKDPLAVFLTQLGRSPVVRRGTQSGVYELDRAAPARLRSRLEALHAELRSLMTTPAATADLTAIRARRAALTTRIGRVEKALEEAVDVLAAPGADAGVAAAS